MVVYSRCSGRFHFFFNFYLLYILLLKNFHCHICKWIMIGLQEWPLQSVKLNKHIYLTLVRHGKKRLMSLKGPLHELDLRSHDPVFSSSIPNLAQTCVLYPPRLCELRVGGNGLPLTNCHVFYKRHWWRVDVRTLKVIICSNGCLKIPVKKERLNIQKRN